MPHQFTAISAEYMGARRIIIAAAVAHNFGINKVPYGSYYSGILVSIRNYPFLEGSFSTFRNRPAMLNCVRSNQRRHFVSWMSPALP